MTDTIQTTRPSFPEITAAAARASLSLRREGEGAWTLHSPAGEIRVPDLATAAARVAEIQADLGKWTGEYADALDAEFRPADAVETVERLCRYPIASETLFRMSHVYLLAARRIAKREGIRAPFEPESDPEKWERGDYPDRIESEIGYPAGI